MQFPTRQTESFHPRIRGAVRGAVPPHVHAVAVQAIVPVRRVPVFGVLAGRAEPADTFKRKHVVGVRVWHTTCLTPVVKESLNTLAIEALH